MKEIVLSEEQQNMLKEMLIKLFGDMAENAYMHDGETIFYTEKMGIEKHSKSATCFVYNDKDSGCIRIHWLEFCLFYLQPKLKLYISTLTIKSLGSKYIDLIYNHFKDHINANNIKKER